MTSARSTLAILPLVMCLTGCGAPADDAPAKGDEQASAAGLASTPTPATSARAHAPEELETRFRSAEALTADDAKDVGAGVLVRTVFPGRGPVLRPDQAFRTHYRVVASDGTVLVTTPDTAPPVLIADRLVLGLREGLRGLRVGERRQVFVPADRAFGAGWGGDQTLGPDVARGLDLFVDLIATTSATALPGAPTVTLTSAGRALPLDAGSPSCDVRFLPGFADIAGSLRVAPQTIGVLTLRREAADALGRGSDPNGIGRFEPPRVAIEGIIAATEQYKEGCGVKHLTGLAVVVKDDDSLLGGVVLTSLERDVQNPWFLPADLLEAWIMDPAFRGMRSIGWKTANKQVPSGREQAIAFMRALDELSSLARFSDSPEPYVEAHFLGLGFNMGYQFTGMSDRPQKCARPSPDGRRVRCLVSEHYRVYFPSPPGPALRRQAELQVPIRVVEGVFTFERQDDGWRVMEVDALDKEAIAQEERARLNQMFDALQGGFEATSDALVDDLLNRRP